MSLDQPSWINLALQIPLALVIVFVLIKFLDFTLKIIKVFLEYLGEQRQLDRDQISEALGRLADEIKNSNTNIIRSSIQEVAQLTEKVDSTIGRIKFFERFFTDHESERRRNEG